MIRKPIWALTGTLWPNSRTPGAFFVGVLTSTAAMASPRMPEPRIAHDREHVREDVESDEHHGEDQAAGQNRRDITLGDGVHQHLPHAGIDEDPLHHHDADD